MEEFSSKRIYRFGLFKADLAGGTLFRQGERVKLQDQPFRVLGLLLERANEVVTREELRKTLWPEGTYVEFEGSLNAALKRVRHALHDSADNPTFIETIPRRGYRFIAPVQCLDSPSATEMSRSDTVAFQSSKLSPAPSPVPAVSATPEASPPSPVVSGKREAWPAAPVVSGKREAWPAAPVVWATLEESPSASRDSATPEASPPSPVVSGKREAWPAAPVVWATLEESPSASRDSATPEASPPSPVGSAMPEASRPLPVRSAMPDAPPPLPMGSAMPEASPPLLGLVRANGSLLIAIAAVVVAALIIVLDVGGIRERRPATTQARTINSLAVLPLESLATDPAQQYFADGITDELITDLAQISNLKVISRTSTIQFKGTDKSIPEIGKALRVEALVEGTVEREANRVVIRVQLIDSASDNHLWARTYDRELRDVLRLQSEAARDIAQEIRGQVARDPSSASRAPASVNPEAYEAYLKGRYFLNKRSPEGVKTGIAYFEHAIAIDPRFALAYAGLADCYLLVGAVVLPASMASAKARTAALKALELDPSIAEGHTALAIVYFYYDWNWSDAQRELQRAIQLNPNYAPGHHWYSVYLSAMGRTTESLREAERAHELDPLSPSNTTSLATQYRGTRRYDRAIEKLRTVLELDPNFALAHQGLGKTYERMGLWKLAIEEFQNCDALGHDSESLASLGHAYGASGDRAAALKIAEQLKTQPPGNYGSPYDMAAVFAGLGDTNQAFAYLQQAYRERDSRMPFLGVDNWFEPLHADPRFAQLCHRLELPAEVCSSADS